MIKTKIKTPLESKLSAGFLFGFVIPAGFKPTTF